MIKKNVTFFMILVILTSFKIPKDEAKIKGVLNFQDPVSKIYIEYRNQDKNFRDSADLINNKFKFELKITEPVISYITVKFKPVIGQTRPRYEKIPVFLEGSKISIKANDSLKFAEIKGSKAHQDFVVFQSLEKPYNVKSMELRMQLNQFRKDNDQEGITKVYEEMDKIEMEIKEKVYYTYLIQNSKSPIALHVLNLYAGYDIDPEIIEPLFEKLSPSARFSSSGKSLKERIVIAKKTQVGAYAMDFTQNDTAGIPVSLSSFKGKYVLLDFWASWCGPCRAENPNLVNAYQQFKERNFTVLGVSLDQPGGREKWLQAIKKDKLPWTQVSDLAYWKNAVAVQYGISAIPQNFLIDTTGKIIAKNLHGKELQKALEKLVK